MSEDRQHVMPGDPDHLQQTTLQWWLRFEFGAPYTLRESNIAPEAFKDGYRAALASSDCDALTEAFRTVVGVVNLYRDVLGKECLAKIDEAINTAGVRL